MRIRMRIAFVFQFVVEYSRIETFWRKKLCLTCIYAVYKLHTDPIRFKFILFPQKCAWMVNCFFFDGTRTLKNWRTKASTQVYTHFKRESLESINRLAQSFYLGNLYLHLFPFRHESDELSLISFLNFPLTLCVSQRHTAMKGDFSLISKSPMEHILHA